MEDKKLPNDYQTSKKYQNLYMIVLILPVILYIVFLCKAILLISKKKTIIICEEDYELINGTCDRRYYSFEALYKTTSKREGIIFFGYNFDFDADYIKEMRINSTKIEVADSYIFKNTGVHTLKVLFDIIPTNLEYMFKGNKNLISIKFGELFNTQNVTSMYSMFRDCSNLTSIDLSNFNTPNVASMDGMFYDCSSLVSIDVSNFNTQKVTSMSEMFSGCSNLTSIDVSNFNTQNIKYINEMFYRCYSLRSIVFFEIDFTPYFYTHIFTNVGSNGIIKIYRDLPSSLENKIPSSWEIIYID